MVVPLKFAPTTPILKLEKSHKLILATEMKFFFTIPPTLIYINFINRIFSIYFLNKSWGGWLISHKSSDFQHGNSRFERAAGDFEFAGRSRLAIFVPKLRGFGG